MQGRSVGKRVQDHVLALGLALVLSFFVYQIAQHSGILTADITGGPQPEFNDYSDVVVHQADTDNLEIFAGKAISDVQSMSFVLLFDPEELNLSSEAFSSPFALSYSPAGPGKATLILTDIGSIAVEDLLLTISLADSTGDAFVVADVMVTFADDTQASLTVQLPN